MNFITPDILEFKQYLIDNQINGLALDIDNTLTNTDQDWYAQFTKILGNPENLSADEFFEKYHYIENAPYYQTQEAINYIHSFVHSPKFYSNLGVLDNSDYFVHQVHEIVPIVAYITMRPNQIDKVTQQWLDRYSFPKAKIISRPSI